ncbi:MAG: hypothetical protein GY862_37385 [Gammaproteobacteria bacterium]|nr:hypothetical protein [Gammaproteobacteria bacterium]
MPPNFTAPKPIINDAPPKVMGFGAGKTMPKTTIRARLYPSCEEPRLRLLPDAEQCGAPNVRFRTERRNQEKHHGISPGYACYEEPRLRLLHRYQPGLRLLDS